MKLAYRIPAITFLLLLATAIVNVVAFQYFSQRYFSTYIGELSGTGDTSPDPARIQALLQIGKLNQKDQKEYLAIFSELANLSESIENISKNPELYMSTRSASGDSMFSIPVFDTSRGVLPGMNFRALGEDTPEGRFVTNILKGIVATNVLWLFIVISAYLLWVRAIFRPIRTITENIQNIIDRKRYSSIRYTGKDEFTPLISTINSLHKTLSIQEKIRSDFLSDLSHEIRTPITAVKCYLEGIQDGVIKLDTKTAELLQSELERLAEITGRIMNFESLTHDVFDRVKVERFDLAKVTDDIMREYAPQLQKTEQKIETQFPRDTLISMDPSMYIQILHNIISNFIKYAGRNTTLRV